MTALSWLVPAISASFGGIVQFCLLSAVILLSAILRGYAGFGFALAAVPLMSVFLPPQTAVVISTGLQFVGGLMDFRRVRRDCDWPSIRLLFAGAVTGAPVGVAILVALSPSSARLLIAALCLCAVAILGGGVRFALMPRPWITAAIGVLAGIFNGLAAMPGPPAVAYYLATPLSTQIVRASLITFFTLAAATTVVTTAAFGLWQTQHMISVAMGLPLMIAGTHIGGAAFRRAPPGYHRRVSLVILTLIALGCGLQGAFAI